MAAQQWIPYNWLFTDDVFYCKTMPFLRSSIRRQFRYASIDEAIPFAYEHDVPGHTLTDIPFGFHTGKAFGKLFNSPNQTGANVKGNLS